MRLLIPALLIAAGTIISVNSSAQPMMGSANLLPAPIGHLQPRAEDFAPNSRANQAVQHRLSTFDAEQQKFDEMLDSKLNICRC
jgi:hypothetical protein